MTVSTLAFTGNPLDRAAEKRTDSAWLAAVRADARTRVLPLWKLQPLLKGADGAGATELVFLSGPELSPQDSEVFLGLDGETAFFAADISSGAPENFHALGHFKEARPALSLLPARDAAILGQAKVLLDWHARHSFCAQCGNQTKSGDGGYRRVCPSCTAEHYPRTDPAVIMLVSSGEECLLGHNRRFAETFFSTLAGFVEPGEAIEDAVRREVHEETGIRVGAVTYFASQPWPFPSSLMIGCFAQATSRDITIDGEEILEARWFTRDHVRALLKGEANDILLPRREAIAHHLIKNWAEN